MTHGRRSLLGGLVAAGAAWPEKPERQRSEA